MNEPQKRRWYQSSVRTLMLGVTLFCIACWCVWQAKIVHHRKVVLEWIEARDGDISDAPLIPGHEPHVSWFRRLLGDRAVEGFMLSLRFSEKDKLRIQDAFPEMEYFEQEGAAEVSIGPTGGDRR